MAIFKNICLVLITIITIVFTVGYAALPIINANANVSIPLTTESINTVITFYISKYTNIINNIPDTYTENTDYGTLNKNIKIFFNSIMYACIGVSSLLALGIIVALFGMKFISKLLFSLALFVMLAVLTIILLIVYGKKYVIDMLPSSVGTFLGILENAEVKYSSGATLISLATASMFVVDIIYSWLA